MAIDLASREPQDLKMVVRLCALSSRLITPPRFIADAGSITAPIEAPPVVIETLARAGQPGRARLVADNVLSPLDRCAAFARLAHVYYERGSRDEALACMKEAKRSASSVGPGFRGMAYFCVARAAHALGEERRARDAADKALSSVGAGAEPYSMSPLNDALWTGLCLRLLRDREGLDRLRKRVDEQPMSNQFLGGLTNLRLQTACATGDYTYLQKVITLRTKENKDSVDDFHRYEPHPWPGNLEFALVDAGMTREFESLERTLRAQKRWPGSKPALLRSDAGKRFLWALAKLGRFTEALDILQHVKELEERARALYRISECVAQPTPDLQRQLVASAERVLLEVEPRARPGKPRAVPARKASSRTKPSSAKEANSTSNKESWRILSWLAPVFLAGGERQRAIDLCDRVCASGYVASPENSLSLPVPATMTLKSHVDVTLQPTDDEMLLAQILRSEPLAADQILRDITSPRVRARAASAIALQHPDPNRARSLVIAAMKDASRCGEGELRKVLAAAQIPYP